MSCINSVKLCISGDDSVTWRHFQHIWCLSSAFKELPLYSVARTAFIWAPFIKNESWGEGGSSVGEHMPLCMRPWVYPLYPCTECSKQKSELISSCCNSNCLCSRLCRGLCVLFSLMILPELGCSHSWLCFVHTLGCGVCPASFIRFWCLYALPQCSLWFIHFFFFLFTHLY